MIKEYVLDLDDCMRDGVFTIHQPHASKINEMIFLAAERLYKRGKKSMKITVSGA